MKSQYLRQVCKKLIIENLFKLQYFKFKDLIFSNKLISSRKEKIVILALLKKQMYPGNIYLFKENIFRTFSEAVVQSCSVKNVFLEISQNPQENTCARVSFSIKLLAWPATLLKKRLWRRCFPVNFVKFLRTPFFIEHFWWLLLPFLNTVKICQRKLVNWSNREKL